MFVLVIYRVLQDMVRRTTSPLKVCTRAMYSSDMMPCSYRAELDVDRSELSSYYARRLITRLR